MMPGKRPVKCVDTGRVFASVCAAARWLGVPPMHVRQAIRRRQHCCGYTWEDAADKREHPKPLKVKRVPMCIYCRRRRVNSGRNLCRPCFDDPAIRRRYPCINDTAPKGGNMVSILEPVKVYPDPTVPVRCPHGEWDGSCPDCERQQRAALATAGDPDDQWDDDDYVEDE